MKTIEQINARRQIINNEIHKLKDELDTLQIKEWRQMNYTEEMETHKDPNDGRKTITALVGRIYWDEEFLEEDTGESITIRLNKQVRHNGRWFL